MITTICWVATAYLGPEDGTARGARRVLPQGVRPFGPGWNEVRTDARLTAAELAQPMDDVPRAILGWVSGCTAIWSALFATGNALYGRWPQ